MSGIFIISLKSMKRNLNQNKRKIIILQEVKHNMVKELYIIVKLYKIIIEEK